MAFMLSQFKFLSETKPKLSYCIKQKCIISNNVIRLKVL